MEITNEIKAIVFAQYLWHRFIIEDARGSFEDTITHINNVGDVSGHEHESIIKNCFVVLRPLSGITDEDAVELVKIQSDIYVAVEPTERNHRGFNFRFYYNSSPHHRRQKCIWWSDLNFKQAQFLQFKGYDLPSYLLGGKTLREAGLAIYSEEN